MTSWIEIRRWRRRPSDADVAAAAPRPLGGDASADIKDPVEDATPRVVPLGVGAAERAQAWEIISGAQRPDRLIGQ